MSLPAIPLRFRKFRKTAENRSIAAAVMMGLFGFILSSVTSAIQLSLFPQIKLFGSVPDLLSVSAVVIAMYYGRKVGVIYALVLGIIADGTAFTLGYNLIALPLFAFFAALITEKFISRNFLWIILFSLTAAVLKCGFGYLIFHAIWQHGNFLALLTGTYLPSLIYTAIIILPVYWLTSLVTLPFKKGRI